MSRSVAMCLQHLVIVWAEVRVIVGLRGTPVLELYHTVNSVCAQKVRILFEEKGLSWQSHLMTLRGDQFTPEYLKLNPNAVVPTLVHDGRPVIESSVILYYLEECFPEPAMMPAPAFKRAQVRLFNKAIDEHVHNACTVLTFALALRPRFLAMDGAARERYLADAPDKQRSEYKRDVIAHGLQSKFMADAIGQFRKLLRTMENALADRPYLAADSISLADIAVIPYILRIDMLRLSGLWDGHGRVSDWYERMRGRASVQRAIIDSMTPADKALFLEVGIDSLRDLSTIARAA